MNLYILILMEYFKIPPNSICCKVDVMLKNVLMGIVVLSASSYGGNVSLSSTTLDDWKSGYCQSVNVTNLSGETIHWEVNLSIEGSVFTVWDALHVQNGSNVLYQGKSDNMLLEAGSSTSFGYCVQRPISHDSSLLNITQTVSSDWGSGLCQDVTLYNGSDKRIKWSIDLATQGEILDLWSANYTQDSNHTLHLNGLDYNEIVEPSQSITFGYCSKRSPKEDALSDAQSLLLDSDALTFEAIKNYNTQENAITKNLSLITQGEHGTTIVWSSSNPSRIDTNGTVYQPTATQGDQTVTLSATITKGQEVQTKTFDLTVKVDRLFDSFNIGFGGSYSFKFLSVDAGENIWLSSIDLMMDDELVNNSYYQKIRNFNPLQFSYLQSKLKNSKFVVYWVTKGWQIGWFDRNKIQEAMNAGYVPIFSYWYFGDGLIEGMPSAIEAQEYLQDATRLALFLSELRGKTLIIMEPEFNKNSVTFSSATQEEFALLMANAIDIIKAKNPQALFSLSMIDKGSKKSYEQHASCGYAHCGLGDKNEWERPSIVYDLLLSRLDFISFGQNIAQFSHDPNDKNSIMVYNEEDLSIDTFGERVINFTQFLQNRYGKPVLLPFVSVATASWSDTNSDGVIDANEIDEKGWEGVALEVFAQLTQAKERLHDSGLFGMVPMALFDDPTHDIDGYQFFLNNEYHLGVIGSSAIDEIDNGIDGLLIFKNTIFEEIFGQSL